MKFYEEKVHNKADFPKKRKKKRWKNKSFFAPDFEVNGKNVSF